MFPNICKFIWNPKNSTSAHFQSVDFVGVLEFGWLPVRRCVSKAEGQVAAAESADAPAVGWRRNRQSKFLEDLKDLPPHLATLVQKALHELDMRDYEAMVTIRAENLSAIP